MSLCLFFCWTLVCKAHIITQTDLIASNNGKKVVFLQVGVKNVSYTSNTTLGLTFGDAAPFLVYSLKTGYAFKSFRNNDFLCLNARNKFNMIPYVDHQNLPMGCVVHAICRSVMCNDCNGGNVYAFFATIRNRNRYLIISESGMFATQIPNKSTNFIISHGVCLQTDSKCLSPHDNSTCTNFFIKNEPIVAAPTIRSTTIVPIRSNNDSILELPTIMKHTSSNKINYLPNKRKHPFNTTNHTTAVNNGERYIWCDYITIMCNKGVSVSKTAKLLLNTTYLFLFIAHQAQSSI
ncbi:PlxyGVORF108-like protein [Hyphantria cunea granulovirus]|uniref:PlxyGVORF108-like protein n=1 Tax=Hyphantria cunea granulovirus TaxID=307448 RepID=A0AAF1D2B1_9BBAC|nr:PlxyGVORF108-like protein [Hyphantria cunea granulovirus]QBQ01663.1 PlxyGVORF108-like protein [Hyphantria cunea granulovirus]